jgi:predicted sulfurtransferase
MGTIILFYKYVELANPESIKDWQKALCTKLGLTGRIILATEGINATLGGSRESVDRYIIAMNAHPDFGGIDFKESPGNADYFPRLRVVVKREIVNLGIDPRELPAANGAQHLTPAQAHELIAHKPDDLIILDGRNNYESRVGAFEGAILPTVATFREFPQYVEQHKDLFENKQVLMYCTGGIRCERASAYLKQHTNARAVYQIEGGIHRYAEHFPNGFFKGKNYVFDARVAAPISTDILTVCDWCPAPYDEYTNCINARCNKQIIMCPACEAREGTACSTACQILIRENKTRIRTKPTKLSSHGPAPKRTHNSAS